MGVTSISAPIDGVGEREHGSPNYTDRNILTYEVRTTDKTQLQNTASATYISIRTASKKISLRFAETRDSAQRYSRQQCSGSPSPYEEIVHERFGSSSGLRQPPRR